MPTEAQRGKRVCPFCGEDAVTLKRMQMTVFGHTYRWELVWYCLGCGANAPKWMWKEEDHNADRT